MKDGLVIQQTATVNRRFKNFVRNQMISLSWVRQGLLYKLFRTFQERIIMKIGQRNWRPIHCICDNKKKMLFHYFFR